MNGVRRIFKDPSATELEEEGNSPGEASGPQGQGLLQEAMATFVRTLLRGVCIEVLLDDGSVLFPEVSLNYDLTHLVLDVNEVQRAIPLQDVESIASAHELERRNILTALRPFLDHRCCTLIIRGLEFVTFRFDTERHREYFAACLELLITRGGSEGVGGDALKLEVSKTVLLPAADTAADLMVPIGVSCDDVRPVENAQTAHHQGPL